MLEQQKIYDFMKNEIQKLAKEEEDKIDEEVSSLEKELYAQAQEDAARDAKEQLDKEMSLISNQSSIESAKARSVMTKQLVAKREAYVNEIFDAVKAKLVEFTTSSEYKDYLVRVSKDCMTGTNVIVYLRKEDMQFADLFNTTVKESSLIKLGGYKAVDSDTQVEEDQTFDAILEQQKVWFYKTSGLTIK